jgi:hypothetical protein
VQQQKALLPTKLAMSDSVLKALWECMGALNLKGNKHSAAFKAPVDTQVCVGYESIVGCPPLDISKLAARLELEF